MADPEDRPQGAEDDEGGGGGGGSKLPLIIAAFTVLLIAIGATFYFLVLKDSGGPEETLVPREQPTPGFMLPMEEGFTVNLKPDGSSIVQINMVFEIKPFTPDGDQTEMMAEWQPPSDDNPHTLYPRIRDKIMSIIRNKTALELASDAGVTKMKQEIINTLNSDVLYKSNIDGISFVKFVIQR